MYLSSTAEEQHALLHPLTTSLTPDAHREAPWLTAMRQHIQSLPPPSRQAAQEVAQAFEATIDNQLNALQLGNCDPHAIANWPPIVLDMLGHVEALDLPYGTERLTAQGYLQALPRLWSLDADGLACSGVPLDLSIAPQLKKARLTQGTPVSGNVDMDIVWTEPRARATAAVHPGASASGLNPTTEQALDRIEHLQGQWRDLQGLNTADDSFFHRLRQALRSATQCCRPGTYRRLCEPLRTCSRSLSGRRQ